MSIPHIFATKSSPVNANTLDANFSYVLNSGAVSVFEFMTDAEIAAYKVGTYLASITTAVQQAVDDVCGANGTLHFPAGQCVIDAPITFPLNSFRINGDGGSETAISSSGAEIRLFDFTNCIGPAIIVDGLSFNGPIGNVGVGIGTGVYVASANGVVLRNCWFRGLLTGCRKPNTASYLDLLDCVFEYNVTSIHWDDGVQCSIQNPLFYRNLIDVYMTGELEHLVYSNARHANTGTYAYRLAGASHGLFTNLSFFLEPGQTFTPDQIRLEGASTYNVFDKIVGDYGRVMVALVSASTATNNRFLNIRALGALDAGIEVGAGNTNNTFSGIIAGADYGLVEAAGSNYYRDIDFKNCTVTGVLLAGGSDCEFSRVRMSGNLIDWTTSSAPSTIWLDEVESTLAGLTATRIGRKGAGIYGRTFYGAAMPTSLGYIAGDRVLRMPQVVGQPKAWARITTGSGHVLNTDWVSEGNL